MSLEHQLPILMKKTQMSGERAQCGLTSLLPMSCRGRAEAFARRLHTRLRSLGSGAPGASDAGETRWLGATAGGAPHRDTDLFFDYELECESPSSPVDECDAPFRDRLIADDDGDTPFYDVDSEPDKREMTPHAAKSCTSPPRTNGFSFTSAFYTDASPIKSQPTPRENGPVDGRLYSAITFDGCEPVDQTIRRELDEADSVGPHQSHPPLCLLPPALNSVDSDSDFESARSDIIDTADEALDLEPEPDDTSSLASDRLSDLSLHRDDPTSENNIIDIVLVIENGIAQTNGNLIEEDSSTALEIKDNEIKVELDVENGIPQVNGNLIEEESSTALEIKGNEIKDEKEVAPISTSQQAECARRDDGSEEEERPQRVRRCSSLKSGKTPPGTPGCKKIVRFADVLGLDLADVKTFMDEIPVIPKSAYEDLANADLAVGSPPARPVQRSGTSALCLVPLFQTTRDVNEALEGRGVCLEAARVADGTHITVCGSVRVRNLDFHKTVHVRYSMDGWRTYTDLQATYVPGSCDGFSDRFTFLLYAPSIAAGQRLELAVRFQCKGRQYWDNNCGVNYCFDCLPLGAPVVASLTASPLHPTRDWHPSFY